MKDPKEFEGHTPGPYVVIENPNKPGDYYVAQENGVCLWDDTGSILNKADAELLAAASKLLAEVERKTKLLGESLEIIRECKKLESLNGRAQVSVGVWLAYAKEELEGK